MGLGEGLEVTHLVESATGRAGGGAAGSPREVASGSCPWVNRRVDVMHYEP